MSRKVIPLLRGNMKYFSSVENDFQYMADSPIQSAVIQGTISYDYDCEGNCEGEFNVVLNHAGVWSQPVLNYKQTYTVARDVTQLMTNGTNLIRLDVSTFGSFAVKGFTFNLELIVNEA